MLQGADSEGIAPQNMITNMSDANLLSVSFQVS
jgi:hypothetical protein